jgi:hypothetical protein
LASVIARAGGFKEDAYVEGAHFFRHKDSIGRVGVDVAKAVRRHGSKANIPLVGGDSLHIPELSNTVKVIGEVGFETSVLFKEGASVRYYIDRAGGFTRRSESNRVVVQYANGESSSEGAFNRKPDAGSVIYVPQGPEPKQVDWFQGINALLGTAGVVLALVLSIQARPEKGLSLTRKVIRTVGSSTVMGGNGRGSSGSAKVSPIPTSGIPATATILPACTLCSSRRYKSRKVYNLETFAGRISPSAVMCMMFWPAFISPLVKRPIAILPT